MGLHIEAELSPAVVGGDGALLDRMVDNLVENAVRPNVQGRVASCLDVTIQPWWRSKHGLQESWLDR
jgi:hypothetical protein